MHGWCSAFRFSFTKWYGPLPGYLFWTTGDIIQTGNITTTGDYDVTGHITSTGYLQLPQVRIENNVISKITISFKNNIISDDDFESPSNPIMTYVYLISGLIGLKFGADWLLDGAVGIAETAGMSKKVIGVTIVAFGTSVPELVASGVAAYRRQTRQ